MVGSNPGVTQCSDRTEVPAQIHSDTVQTSLKIYWMRRCHSPVNTEHWHRSFAFLIRVKEVWIQWQRKDHVCNFSAVSSTCSAAYCRCCQHIWGEECTGSCGVSCHPSPCWSPSNASQPAWHETQRVGPAAAAAPDEAATGMIIWIMLGKRWVISKCLFPSFPLIFSLLAFVQVGLSSRVLAKGSPRSYRHKSLHSPQCVTISWLKLLLLRYWEKIIIFGLVGWLCTLKHYLYYSNIKSVITVWTLLCYVLYKHVRRTLFLLHTVYSWDRF